MSQSGNETMHYPNLHHTTTGKLQLFPPSPPLSSPPLPPSPPLPYPLNPQTHDNMIQYMPVSHETHL